MAVDIPQVENMPSQSAEHDCLTEMAIYSVHHQNTMMHFPGSLRVISRRISPQTHLTLPTLLYPFSMALQPIMPKRILQSRLAKSPSAVAASQAAALPSTSSVLALFSLMSSHYFPYPCGYIDYEKDPNRSDMGHQKKYLACAALCDTNEQ